MKYIIFSIYICLFLFSCKNKKETSKQNTNAPTIVDVIIANNQSITNTIEANGTVIAKEYVELHPEISGRITYLRIPEGSHVTIGTVLARINDADLQAQLKKAKVQLALANKTEERSKKLIDINGINQADYDIALNQVNSIKADINILRAEIDKTIIRAPFTGTIGLRQVSPGAYVTPQTIIATLQQTNRIKIDFTLPENYSNSIRKGSTVLVETDADKTIRHNAVVVAIEPQINTSTRNIKVRAILANGDVNPGAFVKVYINNGTNAGVIVPANAIIPDAKAKKLVVIKKGKASFVNIETGIRQAGAVQITSGINIGDTIAVTGVLFARPNAPVKIRSIKKLEETIQ